MLTCQKCSEKAESQFDSCWKCSTPKGEQIAASPETDPPPAQKWQMAFRVFRGTFATWDELFTDAAAFATEIGTERVLSIFYLADRGDGVVTVWYWATEAELVDCSSHMLHPQCFGIEWLRPPPAEPQGVWPQS
jgi:hypothetical protein